MSTTYALTGKEPLIQVLAKATFPSYAGRKFKLRTAESVNVKHGGYWDGGSRTSRAFVSLSTKRAVTMPTLHPVYDRVTAAHVPDTIALTGDVVCVEHDIFCGKDMGLTFLVHPEALNPHLLPVAPDATEDQRTVLQYTRKLKNTYGGETNIRCREAIRDGAITRDRWDVAKAECVAKGWLTKAGAITVNGKNQVPSRY